MRRMTMTNRWVAGLLTLLLLVEPALVPLAHAEAGEQSGRVVESRSFEKFPAERIPPGDYLKELKGLRGSNAKELEDRACADWLLMIANSYALMGAGEADVPEFYATMERVQKTAGDIKSLILTPVKPIDKVTEYAKALNFLCARLGGKAAGWSKRVFDGWEASTKLVTEGVGAAGGGAYGKLMKVAKWVATPEAEAVEGTIAGDNEYFRWLAKGEELSDAGGLSTLKGICNTIGIGLDVIGFALDAYDFAASEDRQAGRVSYKLVKTSADALLGAAGLVCLFIPGGQIVAIVTLVWTAAKKLGDDIGELNAKWQEAYKNSWWFLMQEDPEFQSFYTNRRHLKDDEKAASLKLVEEMIARNRGGQAATPGAAAFIGGQAPEAEAFIRQQDAMAEAMERQATLVSYYYHTGCTVPDTDIESLKKLWSAKSGFMAWKPQPGEREPWWKRDPGDMAKDWLGSALYANTVKKSESENKEVRRVWFNPDYVLLAKYLNYYMLAKEKTDLNEIVGLRIEQAPFNYLALVEIPVADWSEDVLTEAFGADGFCVGVKELAYLREQVKLMKDAFDEGMEEAYKPFGDVRVDTARLERLAKALETLAADCAAGRDSVFKDWYSRWGETFKGCPVVSAEKKMTPAKFIAEHRQKLEESLALASNHTAQCIIDLISIGMTLKSARDTAALAEAVIVERRSAINGFQTLFQQPAIRGFLEEGGLPGGKSGLFKVVLDWLSGIYPPKQEMEKCLDLFQGDVDEYRKKIDKASKRNGRPLRDLMTAYKEKLAAFKSVTASFEAIAGETEFTVHIPSTDTGVFDDSFDFVADFEKPLQIDMKQVSGDGGGGGGSW